MTEMSRITSSSRGALLYWTVGFTLIVLCHLGWAWADRTPPIWDMAYHEMQGWRFLQAWKEGDLWGNLASLSPVYPPWYYLQAAFWIALTGESGLLRVLGNLGAVFLLSFSTRRLARLWLNGWEAATAALVVLMFPAVAWMSRETVLDLWLAGWVALAAFCMVKSRGFGHFWWTAGFGWAVAGGMLTKWTCPLYLAIPAAWWWWRSGRRWKGAVHLLGATALSVPLVLPYYWPNLAELMARYPTTHQSGLIPWQPYPRHGEPGLNNLRGWVYYPRILAGYFLQLPLLVVAVGGWVSGRDQRPGEKKTLGVRTFLWLWLAGGVVALTFLTPKDPRFALPLAPPLAILAVGAWQGRPRGVAAVLGTALIGFVLVTFPTPLGRFKLALWEKQPDPDFQGLQQEWALLQTDYFGLVGPPRREDWAYDDILRAIADGAAVGFLPELPRFHAEGLQLHAVRAGRHIDVRRLGLSARWPEHLGRFDYVVGKTGNQGLSFTTEYNRQIVKAMRAGAGIQTATWALPDASMAILWRLNQSQEGRR